MFYMTELPETNIENSMEESNNPINADSALLKALQEGREKQILQQRLHTKFGGVVSLMSLWSATCPEKLKRLKGHTAVVKAKDNGQGPIYLYIEVPFVNGEYEELRVGKSDIDEGDEVDFFSIIAIFIDNGNGDTIVRYSANYLDEKKSFNSEEIKSNIIHRCADIMMDSNSVEMPIKITYEGASCPLSKYGILRGDKNVTLYSTKRHDESVSWYIMKIVGYRNARPLTHGLILAETPKRNYDVLNTDGSVLCKGIDRLDYGPNYLICNSRLWWYNIKSNLWEEKIISLHPCNKLKERV